MNLENEQINYLKEQINDRLTSFERKKNYYSRKSFLFYIWTAIISGTTTVILGLNTDSDQKKQIIRISALILTAVVSFLNAYNSFFNYKELWVGFNNSMNRFYKLLFDIEFAEKGGQVIDIQTIEVFKKTYNNILEELNATWQKDRSAKSS